MAVRLPPSEWQPNEVLKAVDLNDTFAAKVPASATAPSSPYVGMVWVDITDPTQPKGMVWNGTGWSSFSGGLPGLGGWADVTAVTGSPTKHEYTDTDGNDWTAYEWVSGTGSATTTEGLVEALIVAGGAGGTAYSGKGGGGGGGGVIHTIVSLSASSHALSVGAGAAADSVGSPSNFAHIQIPGGTPGNVNSSGNGFVGSGGEQGSGGGAGGPAVSSTQPGPGVTLSVLNGTPIEYGAGGTLNGGTPGPANTGRGGDGAQSGGSGVVIVRVPRANAKA